ncbi:hypothetical protein WDU94_011828 [Cyamophila willieti]
MRIQVETAVETVADFYKNGEILLTGGTGFMGKILIEKILRSFSDVNNIYLMVRVKKGSTPEERVEQMFKSAIFEPLNREVPNFRSKIKIIAAEIENEDLGLSPEDKKLLQSKVNIIFHCAASVRFDEELQIAVKTNLYATSQMLNLAKECPHLKMFIYVSTAFSHFKMRTNIEEKSYKPNSSYRELLQVIQLDPNDPELKRLRKKYSKENANTYCLTKAASEQLLSEEGRSYPVCIFRPSIVISTYKDPIPGWIDNLYGPTGLVTGVQAGVVRSIYCDPNIIADMVPVDLAVNALVCTTRDAYNRIQQDPSNLPIYNYVSSKDNPITWYEFQTKAFTYGIRTPPSRCLWYCFCYMLASRTLHSFLVLFLHYLPGYLFDFLFWATGQPMRLIPIYRRLDRASDALAPFSTLKWTFDNQNVQDTWTRLGSEEKDKFPFNIQDLDWEQYMTGYIQGTMIYHLQDSMEPDVRKKALTRFYRLYLCHLALKGVFIFLIGFLLWSIFRPVLGFDS